jgi:hypothetical protein
MLALMREDRFGSKAALGHCPELCQLVASKRTFDFCARISLSCQYRLFVHAVGSNRVGPKAAGQLSAPKSGKRTSTLTQALSHRLDAGVIDRARCARPGFVPQPVRALLGKMPVPLADRRLEERSSMI